MGVLLQTFYWNCPLEEDQEGMWWNVIGSRLPSLKAAGFTALWLPPAQKASVIQSMGYDPYDYYDLGDFDQKGGVKTWFGSSTELRTLIQSAHDTGLSVYADLVLDHNYGADGLELNPLLNQERPTLFQPASRLFPRNWECFHPCRYESFDEMSFGDMPDLCHRNPYVYAELVKVAQWMIEDVGFDGFRFDFVKGYAPWMIKAIAELRYLDKAETAFKPFCVGECWDDERTIDNWLNAVNAFIDNPVSAFDFPLHYRLKNLCDLSGYSVRDLAAAGTVMQDYPAQAVTFVDNHDTIRDASTAVLNDKMLAYAFILTHEGYPSVFWLDYFNYGLAGTGSQMGIDALVLAHERHAGGTTDVLFVDDDLYIMQRNGYGDQSGLVFVLNNRGDSWLGAAVTTRWPNTSFNAIAWNGRDQNAPQSKTTSETGVADFYAAPRGYAVYVPTSF